MRFRGQYAAGYGAACMCAALAACSYDFDGLVAQPGSAGNGGSAGASGQGGASGSDGVGGSAGTDNDGGTDANGGAGTGGSAGKAGSGGSGGGTVDGGKAGADAGKAGSADAAIDRAPDIADVRAETAFDCTAVSGIVYQGHCYYPSNPTTNWDTANTTACAMPSHLVVITTAGEQNIVAGILPGKDRWIGLKKDMPPNMESSFHWVTGEALSFKSWDVYDSGSNPEPNYTGDCVRMAPSNNWGDINCNNTYPAICEHE